MRPGMRIMRGIPSPKNSAVLFVCWGLSVVVGPGAQAWAEGQAQKQKRARNRAAKQPADESLLTLDRIYAKKEFEPERFAARWSPDGRGYEVLERSKTGGRDIVRYDPASGRREILVPASLLIPPGQNAPLAIDGYAFSKDRSMVLIYTNSRRVWRKKTRGDYWVLDRSARQLWKLGGRAGQALDAPVCQILARRPLGGVRA